MSDDRGQIVNLLYRYAELMDAGDLAGAAELFAHAELILDPDHGITTDGPGMLAIWEQVVILHPDGTPRTRHLVTNPIVEIDEASQRATCRSSYTVLQQVTPGDDIAVVAVGRYHDEFQRMNGLWRFARRDYSLLDMTGDLSRHLRALG